MYVQCILPTCKNYAMTSNLIAMAYIARLEMSYGNIVQLCLTLCHLLPYALLDVEL